MKFLQITSEDYSTVIIFTFRFWWIFNRQNFIELDCDAFNYGTGSDDWSGFAEASAFDKLLTYYTRLYNLVKKGIDSTTRGSQ